MTDLVILNIPIRIIPHESFIMNLEGSGWKGLLVRRNKLPKPPPIVRNDQCGDAEVGTPAYVGGAQVLGDGVRGTRHSGLRRIFGCVALGDAVGAGGVA